jgi:hypothetical protein
MQNEGSSGYVNENKGMENGARGIIVKTAGKGELAI